MLAGTIIGTLKYPTDFRKSLYAGQAILTCYKLFFFFFFLNWSKMLGGQKGSVWIGSTGKVSQKGLALPRPPVPKKLPRRDFHVRAGLECMTVFLKSLEPWAAPSLCGLEVERLGLESVQTSPCPPPTVRKMLSEIPPLHLSSSMTKFLSLSFPVCEIGIMMVLAS